MATHPARAGPDAAEVGDGLAPVAVASEETGEGRPGLETEAVVRGSLW